MAVIKGKIILQCPSTNTGRSQIVTNGIIIIHEKLQSIYRQKGLHKVVAII